MESVVTPLGGPRPLVDRVVTPLGGPKPSPPAPLTCLPGGLEHRLPSRVIPENGKPGSQPRGGGSFPGPVPGCSLVVSAQWLIGVDSSCSHSNPVVIAVPGDLPEMAETRADIVHSGLWASQSALSANKRKTEPPPGQNQLGHCRCLGPAECPQGHSSPVVMTKASTS